MNNRPTLVIGLLTLVAGFILIFTNLGHYALWDDEAMDALSARAIVKTGDVSAVLDHNIVAYRNGLLLVNMRHQAMPPLAGYAIAASYAVFGESAWSSRFPFALSGFLCLALLLFWVYQKANHWSTMLFFSLGLLCNVSLLLYFRNSHYYAVGIFCNVAIVYLYLNHLHKTLFQVLLAIVSGLLMTANYSWFVTLYVCLLFDFIFWRRKTIQLGVRDYVRILLPQVPFGLLLLWKFNPLGTGLGGYLKENTFADRMVLYFWNWRDLNQCEFLPGIFVLIALCFWPMIGSSHLKRALAALFIYISTVTVLSTQLVKQTSVSDVRYMAGAIPLCIAIVGFILVKVWKKSPALALGLALVVFGTNLFNGGPMTYSGFRSTPLAYIKELAQPIDEPFTPASKWINEHVAQKQSIWVLPEYMNYPLMFRSPHPVYAWQLASDNRDPQFAKLPLIHFQGRVPPDYVMVLGPSIQQVIPLLKSWAEQNINYQHEATLNHYWKDMYRPELFWRTFTPVKKFNEQFEVIQIFKLKSAI